MNLFAIPWLELAVAVPLVGAAFAHRCRDARAAWGVGFATSAITFGCAILAYIAHILSAAPGGVSANDLLYHVVGVSIFKLDNVNAPLVPLVALLHLLVIAGTTGGKAVRISFEAMLLGEAIKVATFAAAEPAFLVAFLALGTIQPFLELCDRGKTPRIYAIHMGLFVTLLAIGFTVGQLEGAAKPLAWIPLLIAILLRCGLPPCHLWVRNLFENASFGTALLYLTPMSGVYAAVRLLIPVCSDAVLALLGMVAIVAAVYAAGLAIVQSDARRFVACLCIGNTALVLAALSPGAELSVTAGLALWVSAAVTISGAGFALRAAESRVGPLSLVEFHGLYERAPALAVSFLVAGLGVAGFPGTLGFLPVEVMIERTFVANPVFGVAVVFVIALTGFAVMRAYALVFTGGKHNSAIPLGVTHRERFTVLAFALLIFGGALAPHLLFESRQEAAKQLLKQRAKEAPRTPIPPADPSNRH
jgi:NADH-quinone oxidoreductase subunit M